jgi:hypothetical protein
MRAILNKAPGWSQHGDDQVRFGGLSRRLRHLIGQVQQVRRDQVSESAPASFVAHLIAPQLDQHSDRTIR